jgi:hypothetical protein
MHPYVDPSAFGESVCSAKKYHNVCFLGPEVNIVVSNLLNYDDDNKIYVPACLIFFIAPL